MGSFFANNSIKCESMNRLVFLYQWLHDAVQNSRNDDGRYGIDRHGNAAVDGADIGYFLSIAEKIIFESIADNRFCNDIDDTAANGCDNDIQYFFFDGMDSVQMQNGKGNIRNRPAQNKLGDKRRRC